LSFFFRETSPLNKSPEDYHLRAHEAKKSRIERSVLGWTPLLVITRFLIRVSWTIHRVTLLALSARLTGLALTLFTVPVWLTGLATRLALLALALIFLLPDVLARHIFNIFLALSRHTIPVLRILTHVVTLLLNLQALT
jgi:hypothetical protein